MGYRYQKLSPTHVWIIRMHWNGATNQEIADKMQVTPQTVSNVINSEDAKEILAGLQSATFDTMEQVQAELQLLSPMLLDNLIKLATSSGDDRVRSTTGLRLMEMAGHVPLRRVSLEHDERELEKYQDKTEEELRAAAVEEIFGADKAPNGTVLQ